MNEFLRVKRASNSNSERGIRWFWMWCLKKSRKSVGLLCRCNKIITVRPRKDSTIDYSHRCGFTAKLLLEDFSNLK